MRFIAPGKSVFSKSRVFADCDISDVHTTLFMFAVADGERGSPFYLFRQRQPIWGDNDEEHIPC